MNKEKIELLEKERESLELTFTSLDKRIRQGERGLEKQFDEVAEKIWRLGWEIVWLSTKSDY